MDYRRLLPGGHSSSEGSTVGPMVLSLAIFNNLVLTMSGQIGKNPSYKKDVKPREPTLLCVECTISTLVHLDGQCGEFLESWMAYLEFDEFPNLIEYYWKWYTNIVVKSFLHCYLSISYPI